MHCAPVRDAARARAHAQIGVESTSHRPKDRQKDEPQSANSRTRRWLRERRVGASCECDCLIAVRILLGTQLAVWHRSVGAVQPFRHLDTQALERVAAARVSASDATAAALTVAYPLMHFLVPNWSQSSPSAGARTQSENSESVRRCASALRLALTIGVGLERARAVSA